MWEETVRENSHGLCTSSQRVFCKRGCIEPMQSRMKKSRNSHFLPAITETKPWLASSKHLLLGMPKSWPVYCCEGAIPVFACIFSANIFCKLGANTAVVLLYHLIFSWHTSTIKLALTYLAIVTSYLVDFDITAVMSRWIKSVALAYLIGSCSCQFGAWNR